MYIQARLSRMCSLLLFAFFYTLLPVGCIFAPTVTDGNYTCQVQSDCPTGMSCFVQLGLCRSKQGNNETCPTAGQSRECYTGPPGTKDIGDCRAGKQSCEGGKWSTCKDEVLPEATEKCDGKDNDCNGIIDERCPCKENSRRDCYTGPFGTKNIGNCKQGYQLCQRSAWGPCLSQLTPLPEQCDGQDNDCNGKVDDNVQTQRCYSGPPPTLGRGICQAGQRTCQNGAWSPCVGEVLPKNELCNNRTDDDCDGQVDENCSGCKSGQTRSCYGGPDGTAGVGLCRGGTQTCNDEGRWGTCEGQILPQPDICDGQDNNCNGKVDEEEAKRPCYTGPKGTQNVGNCKGGTQICQNGAWSPCIGEVLPQPDLCDGQDNNCNGKIDEACDCKADAKRSCYSGPPGTQNRGNCRSGTQTCLPGGKWGACFGEVTPQPETCDKIDNDCDGNIDGFSQKCYTGTAGTEGVGPCNSGIQTCTGGKWTMCQNETLPADEQCDGIDNDCNGQVDDISQPCYTGTTGCKKTGDKYTCLGTCAAGIRACVAGKWSNTCTGDTLPKTEECNGKDDDCDGNIDGLKRTCYASNDQGCKLDATGKYVCLGTCQTGTQTCSTTWGACVGEVTKQTEVCGDGKDNDCDGQVDNGCGGCTPGTRQDCYTSLTGCTRQTNGKFKCNSPCKAGFQTCNQFRRWGGCYTAITPQKETCDKIDNDCNGLIDDGITCP